MQKSYFSKYLNWYSFWDFKYAFYNTKKRKGFSGQIDVPM